MIKATMKMKDGKKMLFIGLSHGNLDKLREKGTDGYIKIEGKDIGIQNLDVLITAGPTEADITKAIMGAVGPKTKITVDDQTQAAPTRVIADPKN